jgi:hypothetical protein
MHRYYPVSFFLNRIDSGQSSQCARDRDDNKSRRGIGQQRRQANEDISDSGEVTLLSLLLDATCQQPLGGAETIFMAEKARNTNHNTPNSSSHVHGGGPHAPHEPMGFEDVLLHAFRAVNVSLFVESFLELYYLFESMNAVR